MTSEIVDLVAYHLQREDWNFSVPRRLLLGENSTLVQQSVFVPTNRFYEEYDCPCGNGSARITRIGSPGDYRYEASCDHEGAMEDLEIAAADVELMSFDITAYRKMPEFAALVENAIANRYRKGNGVTVAHFSDSAIAEMKSIAKNRGGRPPRSKHSLTQKQIAKIFGVSEQTVYKWEHGLAGAPKGYTTDMRKTGNLDGLLKCVVEYNRLKDFKDVLNCKNIIRNGFNEEELAAINGQIQDLLREKRQGKNILETLT